MCLIVCVCVCATHRCIHTLHTYIYIHMYTSVPVLGRGAKRNDCQLFIHTYIHTYIYCMCVCIYIFSRLSRLSRLIEEVEGVRGKGG